MRQFQPHEVRYIVWQNRAFRFYLAARLLQSRELFSPAAYCGIASIELLLKATLIYWDRSFIPESAGHAIAKLARMARNKVPNAKQFDVPTYFYHEKRFQSVTRYPSGTNGVMIPGSFLDDLDLLFASLVLLVPFQFNSEMARALGGRPKASLAMLRRANAKMRALRKHVGVHAKRRPRPRSTGPAGT